MEGAKLCGGESGSNQVREGAAMGRRERNGIERGERKPAPGRGAMAMDRESDAVIGEGKLGAVERLGRGRGITR